MTTEYIDEATATTDYFAERYENEVWTMAPVADRTRALKTATRLLNMLNWSGTKTDSDQENEFPRNEGLTVPQAIMDACCEIAYNLIDGRDPDFESEFVNVSLSNLEGTRVGKSGEVPPHVLANIPSSIAWNLIRPYLNDASTFRISRRS